MNALAAVVGPERNRQSAPAVSSDPKPKLDRFGRDPNSPGELLRRQTNYDADSGYSPFYAAWLADLPRLSSGQVCTLFIATVGVLSLGRPDNPKKGKRHEWTKPVTVEYLAEVCRCHVRDIQRQIRDLAERKIIAVESTGRGTYKISLLYRDWQGLTDYQPARPVAIDEPEEQAEDETAADGLATSKDAVRLVKRPLQVRPGKMGRSIKVNVGVRAMRWQNAASLPLVYDAVVQNGELVVSTRLASNWRESVGETEANAQRHGCRDDAAEVKAPARAAELIGVFDPLLQKTGGRLLMGDDAAVVSGCKALADMPLDYLKHWLFEVGKTPRASRPISGPRVVASIVREAYQHWVRSGGRKSRPSPASTAKKGGGSSFRDSVRREAARRLEKNGRI